MNISYGSGVTNVGFVGGCVRFYEDGPKIHENGSHAVIGVKNIYIEDGYLWIAFTNSNPVVSINVNTDESLGGTHGIIAGGSGGGGNIKVKFYDTRLKRPLNLNNASDYERLVGPWNNMWFLVSHYLG